jgi:hypothetical protein
VPLLAWLLISVAFVQAPAPASTPAPPSAGAQTPSPPAEATAPPQTPTPTPSPDPAASTFATGVGLLLVPVKADKTADYEAVMAALQAAFAGSTDPERRAVAVGWRVFKATESDAKGNAIYVHALLPAVPGTDYRPSLWLDQLMQEAPTDLLAKYKEALAGSPTRLSLAEVASMGATKK